jgi:hypothetical protein
MKSVVPQWLEAHARAQTDDCIPWPFGKTKGGYGTLMVQGHRTTAHREMCKLVHGEPPAPTLDAAHSCGRRDCCNPRHIRWATRAENASDKVAHGTATRGVRNYQTTITEDQAREIISRLGQKSPAAIARELGVSRAVVKSISAGCSWTWLSGIAQAPSLKKRIEVRRAA